MKCEFCQLRPGVSHDLPVARIYCENCDHVIEWNKVEPSRYLGILGGNRHAFELYRPPIACPSCRFQIKNIGIPCGDLINVSAEFSQLAEKYNA